MAKDLYLTLDLNLLRTFLVLHQELNMRKASGRLHISQPALSQALKKLRNHFDDPLFVKVPSGLEPTYFANELATKVAPHLDGLAKSLNTLQKFEPEQVDQTLRIALSSLIVSSLAGSLFAQLKSKAKNANIELILWNQSTEDKIRTGEVILGIHYNLRLPKDIYHQKLIDIRAQAIVRKEHPLAGRPIDMKDLEAYEFASVVSAGWNDNFNYAANVLAEYDINIKTGMRAEDALTILNVVEQTDMILPHSNLFPLYRYPAFTSLDIAQIEQDENPFIYPIYAHFHTKNLDSPLIHWLLEEITQLMQDQTARVEQFLARR
ncbi:LysR family transcriptional regulator [Vibrio sp. WXL210]|uniref:LysR family transcriptional regulator n=1 Tax=Vibrio sp. WXL210 TaxID=3450709 RepID=UPI003EC5B497